MRSIPEKTLEHWVGTDLAHRFSAASLWWPSIGEDTRAVLPRLAATGQGETILLELKTTETVFDGYGHRLAVDVRQLECYLYPESGPPLPVYYVFPSPFWHGSLAPGRPVDGAGLPPGWWTCSAGRAWFAHWIYVLSAQAVAERLVPDWSSKKRVTLFTVESRSLDQRPLWEDSFRSPGPLPTPWLEFWSAEGATDIDGGVRWYTLGGSAALVDERLQVVGDDMQQEYLLSELQVPETARVGETLNEVATDDDEMVHAVGQRAIGGSRNTGGGGARRTALHVPT